VTPCFRHPNLHNNVKNGQVNRARTLSTPIFIEGGNMDKLFEQFTNEFIPLDREPAPNDFILVTNEKRIYIMTKVHNGF